MLRYQIQAGPVYPAQHQTNLITNSKTMDFVAYVLHILKTSQVSKKKKRKFFTSLKLSWQQPYFLFCNNFHT